ncbi:MAG TPA: GNAT family N-acetyltransferase [Thermomicrobiales bacterium]|nr:GNAT family N-acetyltransferase [Thermomicrobiales bacterium]
MASNPALIEIRTVSSEEYLEAGRPIASYAFGPSPQQTDMERARQNLPYYERTTNLIAFVAGGAQASMVSHEMTQNVRGMVVPMGGAGGVASMPVGRRQGIVRRMFERVFELYHDAEMPSATLYPFRDSFYERLGYASFPKPRFLTLRPEALVPLVRHDKPGTCEQLAMKDGFDEWRAFLERFQRHTHGFALAHVTKARQARVLNESWVALARYEGEVVGAMTFKITGYGEKLIADTFYTVNSIGRYLLLDWIGRHTDQVREAVIELRPDEYPEVWFHDLGEATRTDAERAWPGPMGRVVDVEKLSGIGAGQGEITLEIRDLICPWNNGIFTLRAESGVLAVEATDAKPAGHLTIQGLSALVFTGHDPAGFCFRGWGDPDTETQATLRALFPPAIPDIHEKF